MPIDCWGEEAGIFQLTRTEERFLQLIKCRQSTECRICETKIPSKSYCLGGGYSKFCLKCYEKFLKNFAESIKQYEKQAIDLLNDIKSKEDKFKKNNMLAVLEDNGK